MSTFPDLRSYDAEIAEQPTPLRLPIGGVVYEFQKSIPYRTGKAMATARAEAELIAKAVEAGEEPDMTALEQYDEQQVMRDLFGAEYERMLTDGVHDTEFRRVYQTLFAWHMAGEEAALVVWEQREGDARPPARGTSKARTTSPRSSTKKKPSGTSVRRSGGRTSSRTGT